MTSNKSQALERTHRPERSVRLSWRCGTVVGGSYLLEELLGHGRYGEIYRARNQSIVDGARDAHVALQLVRGDVYRYDARRRSFEQGFRRLQSWAHPNIVEYLELGRDGPTLYLTMELLEGVPLSRVLGEGSSEPLDRVEAMAVVRAVGEALEYAHGDNVVHGDVRPKNVFVTLEYAVKLLDFIPLPAVRPVATEPRTATPSGARPEADVGDDVYGLACLAYELFSGRHPFRGRRLEQARAAGLEPRRIDALSPQAWRALRRGLAFEPSVRPATIAEFLDEFGVTGSERLPGAGPSASEAPAPAEPTPPMPPPARVAPTPVAPAATPPPAPGVAENVWREPPPAAARQSSIARPVVLGAIAIGLGWASYAYYAPFRDGAVTGIAALVAAIGQDAPTRGAAGTAPEPAAAAGQDPTPGAELESSPAAGAAPEPVGASADPEPEPRSASGSKADSAPGRASGAAPSPEPASVPSAAPASTVTAAREAAASRDSGVQPSAVPAGSVPGLDARDAPVTGSPLRVGEGDGAARIILGQPAAAGAALLVWWTEDGTAHADEDYVAVTRQPERFAEGEATKTVFVPLIADSLPETNETFAVVFRPYTNALEPLGEASRIEIVVTDDDR